MSVGNFVTRAMIPTMAPNMAKGMTRDNIAPGKDSPNADIIVPKSVIVCVMVATAGIYDVIL